MPEDQDVSNLEARKHLEARDEDRRMTAGNIENPGNLDLASENLTAIEIGIIALHLEVSIEDLERKKIRGQDQIVEVIIKMLNRRGEEAIITIADIRAPH